MAPTEDEVRSEALFLQEEDRLKRKAEKAKANGGFRNANAERQREASSRLADKYISKDGGAPVVQDEVSRLSDLSAASYDQERKSVAEELGIRVSTLDRLVSEAKAVETDGLAPEPEPWPSAVAGDDLLDLIADTVRDHVILPNGTADVIALWTAFAHAHDVFYFSPLLAITSPTPECGKTVLCDLLDGLVPRPLSSCNVTSAVVYRAIERMRPTLIVDEADSFLPENSELRGILDSGHRRSNAFVLRTVGDNYESKQFTTWAPKVLALIGKLHPTLASRSIHIRLKRMLATESVIPLRFEQRDHLVPLKRKLIRWAEDNAQALRNADPPLPARLRGRAADNWRVLFCVASVAGGEWPDRVAAAAELLAIPSEETYSVMLLEDIAGVFAEKNTDRITSKELVEILEKREDRPWPEYRNGKPITQRQVAKLLEPFGIVSGTKRFESGTAKGYYLAAFEDAFGRYLAPGTPFPSVTTSQGLGNLDF
jgi:putative DNA primase/helicase